MEDAGSLFHEDESDEMLQLLLSAETGCQMLPGKQGWEEEEEEAFSPQCKIEGMEYETCAAVPPIYPTFDCDPHNPYDPRSVSAFLPTEAGTPPSSPGESSSPDIRSPELYDNVMPFGSGEEEEEESSGDGFSPLLDFTETSQPGTIAPSALQFGTMTHRNVDAADDDAAPQAKGKAKAGTTRKRKRARKTGDEPTVQTAVTLPRKQLLTLSSKELDDYASRLRATRPLTPAEEKDLRRQRRLIKNRESASLSRQRRKEHIDVLELQVSNLQAENDQLKAQVQYLSAENVALKERLRQPGGRREAPQSPSLTERLKKLTKVNASPFSAKSSAAAAGACLAIVLFSFGLLFNAPLGPEMAPLMTTQPLVIEMPPSAPVTSRTL